MASDLEIEARCKDIAPRYEDILTRVKIIARDLRRITLEVQDVGADMLARDDMSPEAVKSMLADLAKMERQLKRFGMG